MIMLGVHAQLQHGCHLTLAEPRHQHDAAARELERVVVRIGVLFVNLAEARHALQQLAKSEAGQQPAEARVDSDVTVERKLGAGPQAHATSSAPTAAKPRVKQLAKFVEINLSPTLAGLASTA